MASDLAEGPVTDVMPEVSGETSEPENKTRWGVIDLDWLQEQIDHFKRYDQQYAKGCRDGCASVMEQAVEL